MRVTLEKRAYKIFCKRAYKIFLKIEEKIHFVHKSYKLVRHFFKIDKNGIKSYCMSIENFKLIGSRLKFKCLSSFL